ncbi:MAG: Gfo/Idh/MocA family oxidoreductase [Victivallales bacterium]|nr:Gfo/Idh/MocA family oxidoreductase [Victivallales bacterium]
MDEKLKFAIVGIGDRGDWCWATQVSERQDCCVHAICDTNPVRLKIGGGRYHTNALYTDLGEMLRREQLDAVVVTTPDCNHEATVVAALQANVNVLIDKPLAITVQGCRRIIETAKRSTAAAVMGFNLRHNPVLKVLKRIIASGELGKVFIIENREFYDGGRTYMSRWNGRKKCSGSLWIHKGCHDFDVFNWLLDFPKPVKVAAFAGMNVLRPGGLPFALENGIQPGPNCTVCHYGSHGTGACLDCYDIKAEDAEKWGEEAAKADGYVKNSCMYSGESDAHDNGIAMVEYENGVRASHFECFIGARNDRMYTVVGTDGVAEVSLANRRIVITKRWTGETITHEIPRATGSHGGADPMLLEYFINVITGKVPNGSTIEQGMLSTSIGQAAEIARTENRTVLMDELYR